MDRATHNRGMWCPAFWVCLIAAAGTFACAPLPSGELVPATSAAADKADASAPDPEQIRKQQLAVSKDRLMAYYKQDKGQWQGGEWWQQPILLETMIHLARRLPGDPTDVRALARQVFDLNQKNKFINNYFDDTGWWVLCWLSAYELTAEPRYLEAARVIFDHVSTRGWDPGTCGGGVVWHVSKRYKNAISTELFLKIALRLYRLSVRDGNPAPAYLTWAEHAWSWIRDSGLSNASNLINDGLTDACQNNGQNAWTYNQGVILGALAELYRIKGDPVYMEEAYRIAEANLSYNATADGVLLEQGCGDGTCGDGAIFKGVFVRNLKELLAASPADRPERKRFEKVLSQNATAAWANRLASGLFGLRWDKPQPGGSMVATQCSGLDLLIAAPVDASAPEAAPEICLYENADFGGASACYSVPIEIWMLPEAFQDRVSSIHVFPGACVTGYRDYGYQGDSLEIRGHTSWIGDHWNDQITSLRARACDP